VINNNNFALNFKGTSGDRAPRGGKRNNVINSLLSDSNRVFGKADGAFDSEVIDSNTDNSFVEGRYSNPTQTIPKIILAAETNNLKKLQRQNAFFTGLGSLEYSTASSNNQFGEQAFIGAKTGEDSRSYTCAVSADGSKVVGYSDSSDRLNCKAFIWDRNAGVQDLGSLGGSISQAYDVCANGSKVVGYSHNGTHGEAFIWSRDRGMLGLGTLGGSFSSARAISSDGTHVVGCSHNGANEEAFIWDKKTGIQGLGHLGANKLGKTSSVAYDVCVSGSKVVGYSYNGSEKEAFVWDRKTGMRSLKSVLSKCGLNLKGWQLTEAKTISDDGLTIAGIGINPNGIQEAWMARLDARGGLLARLFGARSR
jgi:probable HAF family extracellular repeat protein